MENKEVDNGLELLKKVIETNEENIKNNIQILFLYEDLLSLLGETESSLREASYTLENSNKVLVKTSNILENIPKTFEFKASKEELKAREQFIDSIPKSIEAHIPEKLEKDLILLNNTISKVNGKSSVFKYSVLGGIGSLVLSIILLGVSGYFTKKWYAESVKTKEEIRSQIFEEMRNQGKDFYEIKKVNRLEMNTKIINKWIEKNPKEGSRFLQFKEGYETK